MKKGKNHKTYLMEHMVFIGFGLALLYWAFEAFLNIFLMDRVNFIDLIIGQNINDMRNRLLVLCLLFIFGSHAQYTIDNRKKAEDALRESEERYRSLVENIPIGICRYIPPPQGEGFITVNPAFLHMFGFDSAEAVRQVSITELFHNPEDSHLFQMTLMGKGHLLWREIELKRKTGVLFWGAITARPVYDEKVPNGFYFDCTFEDIDERKKAALQAEAEAETRQRFQRLLSPDLAEMVVSGALKVQKGGENRIATVLFADIRGFTTMSENTRADEILHMLNEYFEAVVEIVFRYEGTVDKYIGDAIMVNWGAPVAHDDDPLRAVRAALDIRSMLAEFNQRREKQGKQPIHVGIGINTGTLVAGYIGSTQTMSYSVIGDTVNTAARLCSIARPGQIIISDSTYRHIQDCFAVDRIAPILLKGKQVPIQTFNVLDTVRIPTES